MNGKLCLITAICCIHNVYAQDITPVVRQLHTVSGFKAKAAFEVLPPSASEPIIYSIDLASASTPTDTLAPCSYLIQWEMPIEDGQSSGFAAYFSGHHYRYSGDRVQEYHIDWDAAPFMPRGFAADGVQRTAMFADLLPQMLADKLSAMQTDSTYRFTYTPDSISDGKRVSVIEGTQNVGGFDGMEYTYLFDRPTGLPLRIDYEYNPGSISEQSVSVRYSYPDTISVNTPLHLSDSILVQMYPEVFEKYRSSNFHIENLVGSPLPGFSAPTITGERYTHHRGDPMRVPTIVALLDTSAGDPAEVAAQLRSAAASLPFDTDIIWAFVDNNISDIEAVIGTQTRMGEHSLAGARTLARDTGATALPVIILTDSVGTVTDVILGFNKSLSTDVIQKMALANRQTSAH